MTQLLRVQGVFRDVFNQPSLEVTPDLDSTNVEGWDSFNHINLAIALEEAFETNFTTQEIAKLTSVQMILSVLKEKGVS